MGMNCPGGIPPRCGWFQRNQASTPRLRRRRARPGLVVNFQLVLLQREPQLVLQFDAVGGLLGHGSRVELEAVAAVGLTRCIAASALRSSMSNSSPSRG